MNEELEELGARIDGLRLVIAILVSSTPNAAEVIAKLQAAEVMARQRNLPTGFITELFHLLETLEDVGNQDQW
ncbi:hypothetical protein [uncultured Aureimonas sp.]|uniref:hypothetical protein n=1 Tax=uncultured Aureimonas sp. TaxID=1604662 RepID=UPI0025D90A85|nr:hypothetical protein [uncultured Aureimonas sp.]